MFLRHVSTFIKKGLQILIQPVQAELSVAKILSIGQDAALLFSRNLVLRKAGADVFSARLEPALQLLRSQFFELVVLCHTLEQGEIASVCGEVERLWPGSRVLLVTEFMYPVLPECRLDVVLPWYLGPSALVLSAVTLLRSETEVRPTPSPVVAIDEAHQRLRLQA